MIEIKCTKAAYERLIEMASTYYDSKSDRCFLGKTYFSCPGYKDEEIDCKACLRKHIKKG